MNETYRETIVIDGRDDSARAVEGAQRRLGVLERSVKALGRMTIKPVVSIIDKATAPLRGIMNAAKGLTGALGAVGLAGMGIQAIGGAFQGLGDLIGIGVASSFEQLQAQMMAFLKDGDAVAQVMADLQAEAAKTPFSLQDMGAAAAALIPALKGTGMELMDVMKTAEILGSLNPAEGLAGASFAIREALSGDWVSLQTRFNLSRTAINKLKDEGVPAMEIISRVLGDMGVDYSLVAKQGETFAGRMSTLLDTFDQVKLALSGAIFDVLKNGLAGAQGWLDSNIGTLKEYAAVLGAFLGDSLTKIIGLFGRFVDMGVDVLRSLGLLGDDSAEAGGSFQFMGKQLNPVTKLLRTARPIIRDIGDGLRALFGAAEDSGSLGVIGDLIEKHFGPHAAGVARTFLTVAMDVIDTVKEIGSTLRDLVEGRISLGDFLGSVKDSIFSLGGTIFTEVGNLAGRVVDGAIVMLGGLYEGAKKWVDEGGPGRVAEALMGLAESAWAWVSDAASRAGEFLGKLATGVLIWASGPGPGQIVQSIKGLAASAWAWITEAAGKAGEFLGGLVASVKAWVDEGGITRMADAIRGFGESAWAWVTDAAAAVNEKMAPWLASVSLWLDTTAKPALLEVARGIGDAIWAGVSDAAGENIPEEGGFSRWLRMLNEELAKTDAAEKWGRTIENVRKIVEFLQNPLKGMFDNVTLGGGAMDKAATHARGLAAMIDAIGDAAELTSSFIVDLATAARKFVEWIVANTSTIQAFADLLSGDAAGALALITGGSAQPAAVPPTVPAVGPQTSPSGAFPAAAAGGIVTREQIVRVGEGNRPEAIIPLDALRSPTGGLSGVSIGTVSVPMTFAGETPRPEDARLLARRLAPEMARELYRELRRAKPGLVGSL